jgi:hypothetical protein
MDKIFKENCFKNASKKWYLYLSKRMYIIKMV